MEAVIVLPTALKHGLSTTEIEYAWSNFVVKRPRGDDCWVAIGFTAAGLEVELVGLVAADGAILVIHALSPATRKIKSELGLNRR